MDPSMAVLIIDDRAPVAVVLGAYKPIHRPHPPFSKRDPPYLLFLIIAGQRRLCSAATAAVFRGKDDCSSYPMNFVEALPN
jgi:hypothetical protein